MADKAIIIEASTVGKTTLLKYLKENTDLIVGESDDFLIALNGGTYPHDSKYKMNVLAPRMVEDVLGRDKIIFFTNTDYFTPEDLQIARQKGYLVMQFSLNREKMTERSNYRQKHEGYEDHTKYFDEMLAYQKKINERGLVDKVIEMNKSVEIIASELLNFLSN